MTKTSQLPFYLFSIFFSIFLFYLYFLSLSTMCPRPCPFLLSFQYPFPCVQVLPFFFPKFPIFILFYKPIIIGRLGKQNKLQNVSKTSYLSSQYMGLLRNVVLVRWHPQLLTLSWNCGFSSI